MKKTIATTKNVTITVHGNIEEHEIVLTEKFLIDALAAIQNEKNLEILDVKPEIIAEMKRRLKKCKVGEFRCMACDEIFNEEKNGVMLPTNEVKNQKYWDICYDQGAIKTLVCSCCAEKLKQGEEI